MLAGIKDLITVIATAVLLAYSTGQQDRLWKQIAMLRHEALIESQRDWVARASSINCPAKNYRGIFDSSNSVALV